MLKKIVKLFMKNDSEQFVKKLKKKGIKIGEGSVFYDPHSNVIDTSRPRLLSIGKNVRITHGVIILNHDYSWSVLTGVYGEILGGVAPITIGDNVFIGMNSIILKGVTIGDNVIIGAGSVVTKSIPSNEVWAGNPARKITTLSEFYAKRKTQSIDELRLLCELFANDIEKEKYLHEYEPMFQKFEGDNIERLASATGYFEKAREYYKNNNRPFIDYDELISSMHDKRN